MKTIVVAAETFSPNIGDQLIFTCLSHVLQQIEPGLKILPLDLSHHVQPDGTIGSGDEVPLYKRLARFGEEHLGAPYALLNACLQWLRDRRAMPSRKALLIEADLLLIGGGQLLMDNHLGFPVKLLNLTRLAQQMGVPYHLVSCGVGSQWSPPGRYLFDRVVDNASGVSVRDQFSIQRLQEELFLAVRLCPDPALWAAEVFPRSAIKPSEPFVGICPMNPQDFNRSLSRQVKISPANYHHWWSTVLNAFEERRIQWRLFTNGVPQDLRFGQELLHACQLPEEKYLLPPAN
ncbi:MAG: polysaccharide pyruvyl transferase family protein [Saprospiraceae bacterium]|nr:polysaccharide pyruvyl transferase family protein [Saprospiraceae bacterium]